MTASSKRATCPYTDAALFFLARSAGQAHKRLMTMWDRFVEWLGRADATGRAGAAPLRDPERDVQFTMAVVGLSAKLARADGEVTADEVEAFFQTFDAPPSAIPSIKRVFDLAGETVGGFEGYARTIAQRYRDQCELFEKVLDGLFHIAKANGRVDPPELDYLEKVAKIFGFTPAGWRRISAAHLGAASADPYAILEVDPAASDEEIRAAYRKMIASNHPDRFISLGLPREFERTATEKTAAINRAYESIRRERASSFMQH